MRYGLSLLMVLALPYAAAAENFEIPPQITPAIRSACEKDVRRLCVRTGSTQASVKSCVIRKFTSLNTSCQYRLVTAGLVSKKLAKKKPASQKSRGNAQVAKRKKPAKAPTKTQSVAATMFGIE